MNKSGKYTALIVFIILLDQAAKIWVHFNMPIGALGQIKLVGNWLKLYHILNPGMAFGIKFGFKYGKLFLTVGRLVASAFIVVYIRSLLKKSEGCKTVIAWSLILAGAVGNVIDSVFYGVLFGNAPQGALSPWMHGQVIDMIYIDIVTFKMPDWMPFFYGQYVKAFPIFNIADVAITFGVILLLLANKNKTEKS